MRPTRAIIHTDNFRHNLRQVIIRAGSGREICVALKADAYGHGAVELSRIALDEGAHRLGVATLEEAANLREAGLACPILLLGLTTSEEWPRIVDLGLEPVVAHETAIAGLSHQANALGKTLGVHLKVDTGMGRIGCTPEKAPSLAEDIVSRSGLTLRGLCTHFPAADFNDPAFTRRQAAHFRDVVESVRSRGVAPGVIHAANSGAVIAHDEALFDMVRPGIMLYGYYPSQDQERWLPLKPVMDFRSRIVSMKMIPKGTPVSYGLTWSAPRDTVVAIVPAGYADGVNRLLSNIGEVFIQGRRYPMVGRICMDQFLVDLGPQTKIKVGDDVILFGPEDGGPTAEEWSDRLKTIPYEITCRIDKRVPRVFI